MSSENPGETSAIRIGISSCLLGQRVRYDGGHKHNDYLSQTLGRYVEFIPFCPEMAVGLGVPRRPIRLVARAGEVRAVGIDDPRNDVTEPLSAYGRRIAGQLADVCGYIFKSKSPSCGMERVKVYADSGMPAARGTGVYAAAIMAALPELPVEEEGRLMDPVLRENFIERIFIYHRWQQLAKGGLTPAGLIEFHERHKFNLLAHDETAYRRLGRLVAGAGAGDLETTAGEYVRLLMAALKRRATRKRHANVLTHIFGFLKRRLDADDKRELLDVIESYRLGYVPLIVPVTLLKHFLRRFPDDYVNRQYYLTPHPRELMLRNHI